MAYVIIPPRGKVTAYYVQDTETFKMEGPFNFHGALDFCNKSTNKGITE